MTRKMLSPSVKKDIRTSYENLKSQLQNFIPRKAQNYLVAEIAKTLAGEYNPKRRILVAEAGTGIGKSMAYLLGSISFAVNNNKKVVVSTATVALQEQLIEKDLPLFRRVVPKAFSFVLAKGRQRYCCGQKLAGQPAPKARVSKSCLPTNPKNPISTLSTICMMPTPAVNGMVTETAGPKAFRILFGKA